MVAISIPVFTAQLESSKEATDAANIRAAYAEAMVDYLENQKAITGTTYQVTLTQGTDGWARTDISTGLGNLGATITGTPKAGGTATITVDAAGAATITYSA